MSSDNVLQRGCNEQKFLFEAHAFADFRLVVGIEHIGETGVFGRLIEKAGIEALQLEIARGFFGRPKAQRQNGKIRSL